MNSLRVVIAQPEYHVFPQSAREALSQVALWAVKPSSRETLCKTLAQQLRLIGPG